VIEHLSDFHGGLPQAGPGDLSDGLVLVVLSQVFNGGLAIHPGQQQCGQ
jgi:hypothetical protein